MANARRQYSLAEELALTTQVDGHCPLCDKPLFYEKRKQKFKGYELAHIFPLNPRPEELLELEGVHVLSSDVNHPDNLIPLCHSCHKHYDKPRTREEYDKLRSLKRVLLSKAEQRLIRSEVRLEAEIERIIARLHELEPEVPGIELALDAKKADDKFDDTLPILVRRKIKRAIEEYYILIQKEFRELELQSPTASELIFVQVRTFYLKQKKLGLSQAAAFENVVGWLRQASDATTLEAAEIVASFFVQNCEVFE